MTSVFLPSKDKFPVNSCSEPCREPFIPTPLCEPECDSYTFGPFTTPATVYTYYDYDTEPSNTNDNCGSNCNSRYLKKELEYYIYQIIDGVEHLVGPWLIKDKVGPNKREFKECGEYILRFCSEPPNECYPDCIHPTPPEFRISKENCCDGGYVKGLYAADDVDNISQLGNGECIWEPEFEEFSFFEVRLPECCSATVETSKGIIPLDEGENWATFKEYSCPFDYIKVTANCECINDIRIIVQR